MTVPHEEIVRSYLGDLIAVVDHVSQAVARQAGDEDLKKVPQASAMVQDLKIVLERQHADLKARIETMGGATSGGVLKEALTSVTGALAGLYSKVRGESCSRMLRDDYTAMNFAMACTGMLHTTALACSDTTTAELTRRHLQDFPPLIMALGDLLPRAVLADLQAAKSPISNSAAAEQTMQDLHDAWRSASSSNLT